MSPASLTTSASSAININPRKRSPSTSRTAAKLAQFFSTSPKAAGALSAAVQEQNSSRLSPSTLSLPTISLSTATADTISETSSKTTMLFSPPSAEQSRKLARQHAQFAPLSHPTHRYVSQHPKGVPVSDPVEDDPPYYYLLTTYISYLILIVFGHVRDFFGKIFREKNYKHLKEQNGYAPLNSDFDNFYVRRLKVRINDCFARPITGVPGRYITLLDRKSDDHNVSFKFTGTQTESLNMSSYNYLGFAQSEGPCADAVEETLRKYGSSSAGARSDAGSLDLHVDVEKLIANFVGKPASMIFSMGYATNATAFSAFVSKGCLVISDELNHASIRYGVRLSGAVISMFKHNDMKDLERLLREQIAAGQPRSHRPWKKILVVVEGLYSMEGTMCNLPELIALKKKYKFNLFVDEAHSIGALGPRGRGVCDYFGIDPSEVDILMGTLTKSFGANGGYIAAEKHIIEKLRSTHAGNVFGEAIAPGSLAQISVALRLISGDIVPGQGEERLQRLAFNSRYLRLGLKRLGFIIYGQDDSPIIPLLLYNPAKMPAFSHEMLKRKIAVVIVGYPATPLVTSRARFCVSAAHNKEDLDRLLEACDEIGDILQLKFSSGIAGGAYPLPSGVTQEMYEEMQKRDRKALIPPRWPLAEVIKRGVHDTQLPLR
ncbi:PLP-dependent transferase [Ascodesmis nigricans]|uniref:PLP-dependent transferase n=1 Tax=Ascodesmis nigricans TaxID=341454 RepID=A0A4S2N3C2_9PEZI|nr:PLP-dependent transferase [Ascodesmis nigricans]